MKAIVFTAVLKNGTNAQVKAYSKDKAYEYLLSLDSSLTMRQVRRSKIENSHQVPIENNFSHSRFNLSK
jgi:hypothetical protein